MKINSLSGIDGTLPARLLHIPQRPTSLSILGSLPEYSLGIAIVGTRKPTAYGRQVTAAIASRFAERGAVIISGLAHGVDGIAHEAALRAGGITIAVLPTGLDQIYPSAHRRLAEQIVTGSGALISEYAPGTPPLPYRFLERNRLVSGLADIVIVTEAGIRSGTMNTTMHALEQGKDVYAVPGPITSAMSAGCNALIAQGASPVVTIDDLVERILPRPSEAQPTILAQNETEQAILELLMEGVSDGDELQTRSGLEPNIYSRTLTMLEIRGAVRSIGANRWSL